MNERLEWLARNVHTVEEGSEFIGYTSNPEGHLFALSVDSVVSHPDTTWFPVAYYRAARAKLQNKPNWDEVRGNWMCQDAEGIWDAFEVKPYEFPEEGTYIEDTFGCTKDGGYSKGEVLGDWRDTLEQRPNCESEITESDIDESTKTQGASAVEFCISIGAKWDWQNRVWEMGRESIRALIENLEEDYEISELVESRKGQKVVKVDFEDLRKQIDDRAHAEGFLDFLTGAHEAALDRAPQYDPEDVAFQSPLRDHLTEAQEPSKPAGLSKYHREIKEGVYIDVYDVLKAFNVTNPADAHAIKKMLMPGQRGSKSAIQDRHEAIQSIQRAIQMECGK